MPERTPKRLTEGKDSYRGGEPIVLELTFTARAPGYRINEVTGTVEFKAAREAIITHFADVDEYQVDWVLYGYGKYLEDSRMIPALENMLRIIKFNATRAAIENQLAALRTKN